MSLTKKNHRTLAAGVLILLFALGLLINESDFIGQDSTAAVQYLKVYSAFLPFLAYIVPFGIFMRRVSAKYRISGLELLAAAGCGAFISSAFAGELNGGFDDLMTGLMGKAYSDAWLGSLETGIAEELLKLGTAALLLYALGRKSLKDYLSIGMCVGMGFQMEEDIAYITDSGFKDVNQAFPAALDRVSCSLGSHWAYAAVTAAGLYLIVRTSGKNHRRKGLGWILLVMADHFLYDSPIGEPQLFNALLTVAVVLPVILFFLLLLGLYYFSRSHHRLLHRDAMFYFALMAGFILARSEVRQLCLDWPVFWKEAGQICLLLLPLSFARLVYDALEMDKKRTAAYIMHAYGILAVAAMAAELAGFQGLEHGMFSAFLLGLFVSHS